MYDVSVFQKYQGLQNLSCVAWNFCHVKALVTVFLNVLEKIFIKQLKDKHLMFSPP